LLGASLRWQGKIEDAVGHVEFACAAFTVLGEPGRTAVAANFLGWTYLSLGRLDEARRWFEKSLDIHCRLNASLRMAQNYQNLAIVCYKQGDYPLAAELLEKELLLVGDQPDMECRTKIALGNVLRLRGDFPQARACLLEAFSLASEHDLAREETLALEFMGDVFRDEGNLAEARHYYQRGLDAARSLAPRGDLVMELMRREGECLDLAGQHEEAHFLLNDALNLGNAVNDRFELAVIRRCLGVNAANLGRWKQAAGLLEQALHELRSLGAKHEVMLANRHLSRILLRQIDSGNAGAAGGELLEQSWRNALSAQQLSQELETPLGAEDINDLVGELARRRLLGGQAAAPTASAAPFSSHRVPCTRVLAVSGLFQQVLKRCDGFSRYKNPVLLMGEAGTGKELLARRIHENSPRGASPFIRVCCTGVAAEELAREIFGVAAGAQPGVRRPDRKSTRLNSSHKHRSRMPSSA
jgi:tetratricopeptide (TPR) repeat protein